MTPLRSDQLVLYNLWEGDELPFPVVPGPTRRQWVREAGGWPYKCLPLRAAAEAGWALLSPARFRVRWDGGRGRDSLHIDPLEGRHFDCIASMFGLGVLTFNVPYLFRTPPEVNLWVRGPANTFKDGIQPMEGLVETDWLEGKFTMNWKLTRPGHAVEFEVGDPVCVITPFPRGYLQSFRPEARPIRSAPDERDAYERWKRSRREHIEAKRSGELPPNHWQGDYYYGRSVDGSPADQHERRLELRRFTRPSEADGDEPDRAPEPSD